MAPTWLPDMAECPASVAGTEPPRAVARLEDLEGAARGDDRPGAQEELHHAPVVEEHHLGVLPVRAGHLLEALALACAAGDVADDERVGLLPPVRQDEGACAAANRVIRAHRD